MPQAWDTTTAARLRPDSPELEYVTTRWQLGDPVAFTASTLNEIFYGLRKATLPTLSHLPEGSDHPPNRRGLNPRGASGAGAQLGWLRDQIVAGLIDVLAFEHQAADIAGALRARMPTPPASVAKRSKGRSKAEDRVAWAMDLQTSATVFVHGYDLVTADAHHPVIAKELSALAPTAPPLLIEAPPKF